MTEFHRVTAVFSNGVTETIDGLSYEQANAVFNSAVASRRDAIFTVWLELGFGGTPDAQWVIVNQYAKEFQL